MIVECVTCPVQGIRCDGCVVAVLAGIPLEAPPPPGAGLPLDPAERKAVAEFVRAGLLDSASARALRARTEPGAWSERVSG